MTIVSIKEFSGYSVDSFYEYLRIHGRAFIEVIIPKEADEENAGLLIDDYFRAIYVGQLLTRISDEIMFTHPHPYEKGEFSFIIITTKWKKLAKLLFLFSQSYDWDNNFEASLNFSTTALNIQGYLKEGERLTCESYLEIINDYLEED